MKPKYIPSQNPEDDPTTITLEEAFSRAIAKIKRLEKERDEIYALIEKHFKPKIAVKTTPAQGG